MQQVCPSPTVFESMKKEMSDTRLIGAKVTKNLMLCASMAIVGSTFQFGYNTGVINAPQHVIETFFNETFQQRYGYSISGSTLNLLWGITVAIFAAGGMIGSLCAGAATKKLGLKRILLYNNVFAAVAAIFLGCSQAASSFEMLIIGRLLIGVNSGINMVVAPMYLTDCAPVEYRGVFGTLGQFGVVTSMLLSQVLGLQWLLGTKALWPLLLGLTGVFVLYQVLVLPACPDSPRWLLVVKKNEHEAFAALRWLRGDSYDVKDEIESIRQEMQSTEHEQEKIQIADLFRHSHLRRALLVAVVMQLSQQLSGINAVFYYSTGIFGHAGVKPPFTAVATLGMGVVNVIMTAVSISLIEIAGRRILHLIGLGGMCFCAVVLAVLLNLQQTQVTAWLTLVPIFLFVAFFQTGPGAIPWFITAEIFNQNARPAAASVAGLVNWFGNFAVALAYPPLAGVIGGYTFIIFAVLLVIFWIFTFIKVPETKGRSIHDITSQFKSSMTNKEDVTSSGTKL